jgi:hypothetical protein
MCVRGQEGNQLGSLSYVAPSYHLSSAGSPNYTPCSHGLPATSQRYFSLTTNQPPATSQQYSSLRRYQHQPSATSQPNRLIDGQKERGPWASPKHEFLARHEHEPSTMISGLGRHEHDVGLGWAATSAHSVSPARHENNRHDAAHVLARGPIAHLAQPARSYIKNTHLPLTLASLPQSPPPSFLPQPQAEPQAAAGISTVATVSHFRHRYRPPHPRPSSFPRHTWRRRSPPLPPRTWRRYGCDEEAPAGCGLRLDPWPLHAVGRAPRSRICGPTSTRGEEVVASPSPLRQLRCRLLR